MFLLVELRVNVQLLHNCCWYKHERWSSQCRT